MSGAPRDVDQTPPAVERVEDHRKVAKELLQAVRDFLRDLGSLPIVWGVG